MRILPAVDPTAEQLAVLAYRKPGTLLLRGAAGSGKTTTALLRLRQQTRTWLERRARENLHDPVRVLVLTYNRTLEGYIAELARQQVAADSALKLTVSTHSKWALELVRDAHGAVTVLDATTYKRILTPLIRAAGLDVDWAVNEVDYLMGRYRTADLELYMTDQRTGRGVAPRVDSTLRRRILDEIVYPFQARKVANSLWDWSDIAHEAALVGLDKQYDVVIIDEAQDFSANQMRAVVAHLSPLHSMTIVMDAAQRIYPRSFTWKEAGVIVDESKKLTENHRNTKQVAAFARSLLDGVPLGDDGTLPDLSAAKQSGALPVMLEGKYSDQIAWILDYVENEVPVGESVAFLQVRGGQWFSYVRKSLTGAGIEYCELTREKEWPQGAEEVALVTFHSAKGLEFDHVVMLGMNQEVTPHGPEAGDGALDDLRKLVAMGIGRARKSVVIGYKASDASTVIGLFAPDTYKRVKV